MARRAPHDPFTTITPLRTDAMAKALRGLGFKASRARALAGLGSLPSVCSAATARERSIIESALALDALTRTSPVTPLLTNTDEVIAHFRPHLAGLDHERLYVVLIDCRNRMLSVHLVACGGLTGVSVHPREILVPAIREAAAGILLVHNHPSGDPTPSQADRKLTHRVRQAGDLIGIPLLDHVVIAARGAMSV